MRHNGDRVTALHEASHAVVAQMSGVDVRQVVLHRPGSRQDEAGRCELFNFSDERDADPARFLVYLLAGAAAEKRAVGEFSERDAGDVEQAVTLAAVMLDVDTHSPRVKASVQAAQAVANAHMLNDATWGWIERVADALIRRRRLTGRDIHELRPAEARR